MSRWRNGGAVLLMMVGGSLGGVKGRADSIEVVPIAFQTALIQITHGNVLSRERAARVLGASKRADAVPALMKALTDREGIVQVAAMSALGNVGAPAIPALTLAAIEHDGRLADRLSGALSAMDDDQAVPALLVLLTHERPRARRSAAVALGRARASEAVEALTRAVDDADPSVREAAARSLVSIGSEAFPGLAEAAEPSHDRAVRAIVMRGLGWMREERAIPVLERWAQDANESVRREAVTGLGRIGVAAVPALIHILHGPDREMQGLAARLLWGLEDPALPPAMLKALGDYPDTKTALTLINLLWRKGSASLPGLVSALRHPSVEVRRRAAEAIGFVKDPLGVSSLGSCLLDASREVRLTAVRALAWLGWEAVPVLQRAMEDPDLLVRRAAREGLEQLGEWESSPFRPVIP